MTRTKVFATPKAYPDVCLTPTVTVERTEPEPQGYIVSVDLGSQNDRTAMVVNRYSVATESEFHTHYAAAEPVLKRRTKTVHHAIVEVYRPRVNTPYPAILAHIERWLDELPPMPKPPQLVVDGTGLGGPVVDWMNKAGLAPFAIDITAGTNVTRDEKGANVPKSQLVGVTQVALQSGRLKIAAGIRSARAVLGELQAFKVKISQSGAVRFEAGGTSHDDIVMALSMAVWYGEYIRPSLSPDEVAAIQRAARDVFVR